MHNAYYLLVSEIPIFLNSSNIALAGMVMEHQYLQHLVLLQESSKMILMQGW